MFIYRPWHIYVGYSNLFVYKKFRFVCVTVFLSSLHEQNSWSNLKILYRQIKRVFYKLLPIVDWGRSSCLAVPIVPYFPWNHYTSTTTVRRERDSLNRWTSLNVLHRVVQVVRRGGEDEGDSLKFTPPTPQVTPLF